MPLSEQDHWPRQWPRRPGFKSQLSTHNLMAYDLGTWPWASAGPFVNGVKEHSCTAGLDAREQAGTLEVGTRCEVPHPALGLPTQQGGGAAQSGPAQPRGSHLLLRPRHGLMVCILFGSEK